MQELMTYIGKEDCYGKCNKVIKKFIDVEVSEAQVYRVTDAYGKELGKTPPLERTLTPLKRDEVLYVEPDASLLFLRKEQWKEVKVGRIFKSGDCKKAGEKPGQIAHSQYLALLGDSATFTDQMDELIASYGPMGERLVFISDGATWIRNWISTSFPKSISILDYYHATQHLHEFANGFFRDDDAAKKWTDEQKELLLQSQVADVIVNIQKLAPENEEAQKLINYYSANKDRMDYKRYKQIGCGIIGSGAIESAHRTVVQKRMKLSGQRWTRKGAQNMLNLRVTDMNEQWDKVIKLAKTNFRKAA